MRKQFSFERALSHDNPVQADEVRPAEQVLARLVAAAFAGDHPELFGNKRRDAPIMGSRTKTPAPSLSRASDQGIKAAGESHACNK